MQPACSLLLVDDDEEFLEILNRRFVRRGLATAAASTPDCALAAIQDRSFQVAVIDRSLPGLDGIELMKRLRRRLPELQVIMLSGHADPHSIEEARQAGAFEYLVKPCSLADLEAAIMRACDAAPKVAS